jgi:hypothetical protein
MKTSKTLSPKQKKIAQMAGDPNKIEGEDFKKLKPMKANEGVGIDKARKHKQFVKEKLDTAKGYAKEMLGISSADRLTQKDYELMRNKTADITAKDRLTPRDYELMKEKRKERENCRPKDLVMLRLALWERRQAEQLLKVKELWQEIEAWDFKMRGCNQVKQL